MSKFQETLERRPLVSGLTIYAVIGLLTVWAGRSIAGGSHVLRPPLVAILVGAVIPAAIYWTLRRSIGWSRVFEAIAIVMMVVALERLWRGTLTPFPYGDGGMLGQFLQGGIVFSRWLLGMAVITWLYVGVWQCPPIAGMLPASVQPPFVFASLLAATVMGIGSVALLRRWPNRLAVILPMLTPVWVLFSIGYLEYYPFMIGLWLATLLWLFERRLEERSPVAIGAIVGVLPTLYVGFVPTALIIAVVFAIRRPQTIAIVAVTALAAFAFVVTVSFPGGVPRFFPTLYSNMLFGNTPGTYARYSGQMSGPNSIVFSASYALGWEHLKDVAFNFYWGAGWGLAPLLAWGAASTTEITTRWRGAWADARLWLGLTLVAWHVYDIFFVLPKMGPAKDLDFMCTAYVMLAFAAGRLLDRAGVSRSRWLYPLLCGVVAIAIGTSVFIAYLWLPRRP